MPVTGRKPKDGPKINHHAPTHAWAEVVDLPYDGPVPKLPRRIGGWPARARATWKVWSSMPHCRLWKPADWQFAIDTLEVAARFYEGDRPASTELRNREKVLGTTADYRRDLRIRYVAPDGQDEKAEEPARQVVGGVTNLDDFRDRDLFG